MRSKIPGTCFFWKKKPPAGLHHTESQSGDAPTINNCFTRIQISRYPACMGPSSENHTLHGGAERRSPAAVPKIIPMQAGRVLRGPFHFLYARCLLNSLAPLMARARAAFMVVCGVRTCRDKMTPLASPSVLVPTTCT